jgi:hypothetical protein
VLIVEGSVFLKRKNRMKLVEHWLPPNADYLKQKQINIVVSVTYPFGMSPQRTTMPPSGVLRTYRRILYTWHHSRLEHTKGLDICLCGLYSRY